MYNNCVNSILICKQSHCSILYIKIETSSPPQSLTCRASVCWTFWKKKFHDHAGLRLDQTFDCLGYVTEIFSTLNITLRMVLSIMFKILIKYAWITFVKTDEEVEVRWSMWSLPSEYYSFNLNLFYFLFYHLPCHGRS